MRHLHTLCGGRHWNLERVRKKKCQKRDAIGPIKYTERQYKQCFIMSRWLVGSQTQRWNAFHYSPIKNKVLLHKHTAHKMAEIRCTWVIRTVLSEVHLQWALAIGVQSHTKQGLGQGIVDFSLLQINHTVVRVAVVWDTFYLICTVQTETPFSNTFCCLHNHYIFENH